jgi:hypothetical protein
MKDIGLAAFEWAAARPLHEDFAYVQDELKSMHCAYAHALQGNLVVCGRGAACALRHSMLRHPAVQFSNFLLWHELSACTMACVLRGS